MIISDLFNKKRVSGFKWSLTSSGSLTRALPGEDSTSGRDRTQRERSASLTLRKKLSQSGITYYARTYALPARLTPTCSTTSTVSRRPAVSLRTTGKPPMSKVSVSTSRVVPGMGDVIAASRWATRKSSNHNLNKCQVHTKKIE